MSRSSPPKIGDLTPPQFAALAKLADVGETSQNQLGSLIAMDAATVKGVIDRLKARGLVELTSHDVDKRRLMVSLTVEGRETVERLIRWRKRSPRDLGAAVAEGSCDAAEIAATGSLERSHALRDLERHQTAFWRILSTRARFGGACAGADRLAPERHGRILATRVRWPSTTRSKSTKLVARRGSIRGFADGGASSIRSSGGRRLDARRQVERPRRVIDLDYGFTPATNLQQLKRARWRSARSRVLGRLVRHRQGHWSSCRRSTSAGTRRITGTSRRPAATRRCWRSTQAASRGSILNCGRWKTGAG